MTSRTIAPVGVTFTETMRGFWSTTTTADYEEAAETGKRDGSPLEFTLTVTSDDIQEMLADPEHRGKLTGSVSAPDLDDQPLVVDDGIFKLFNVDQEHAATRNMDYQFQMTTQAGKTYFFHGHKVVRDTGAHVWRDTTTLFVNVYEGDTSEGPLLGRGVLRILLGDFVRQLASMQATGAGTRLQRLEALAAFNRLFLGGLVEVYGRVLAKPSVFRPDAPPRERRQLRLPEPELRQAESANGALLELTRYRAGSNGPVLLVPGIATPASSFAIDTIETNLAEFLAEHEYDVWLLDYRASLRDTSGNTEFTLDDLAEKDLPAAVAKVCRVTRSPDVQVVAHGTGSLTLLMALLSGLTGVRSAVCSQMGTHFSTSALGALKSGSYLAEFLSALGTKRLDAYYDARSGWTDQLYDKFLHFYPTRHRCNSPVCRRILVTYGEVFKHEQLNAATHDAIHELFGASNLTVLKHLARLMRTGHVVAADGSDAYLPHAQRLRLPLTFIHGADNRLLLPAGTRRTFGWLCDQNGEQFYTYHEIPEYGHLDCFIGRDGARDVFPVVLSKLEPYSTGG